LRVWRGVAGRIPVRLKSPANFYVIFRDIPENVRLLALATWTRRAGRATLEEAEAIWEARRLARTRVEAIVCEGGVVLEVRKMG